MTDYRVNLDIYNGPMDLLLYLIRRDEIDVHDIPIARITEQYCAYVDTLKILDPDLAGDFLVMAATLMEIKTRMLLPSPVEAGGDEEPVDPRAELVRQLLEYKAFKDAAGDLRSAATDQSLRFGRRPAETLEATDGKDLDEVHVWDLVEAFGTLMTAVGHNLAETEIVYDDTPVELHATDILDRLKREGGMTFRQIFAGRTRRTELVGLFLALLELIRRRSVHIEQESLFGEIYVFLDAAGPPPQAEAGREQEQRIEEETATPEAEAEAAGQYVAESPSRPVQDEDDDSGTEVAGTGA